MGSEDTEALRSEVKHLRETLAKAAPTLEGMLRLRGFDIHVMEQDDDLLLPAPKLRDGFYQQLKRYPFRIFLRDVIKHQEGFLSGDVAKYPSQKVTEEYIAYLMDLGLLKQDGRHYSLVTPIRSFGPTLEWFMAELFRRKFLTEALWGLRFRGRPVGGDYDLIARLDCSLLYMEIKSSPPKQTYQSEIEAFLDRVDDLNPAVSIFFMDTELRMKDKMVPMFEEALAKRSSDAPPVVRMYKELFHIEDRTFIINAKDTIAGNLRTALGWYYRRHP